MRCFLILSILFVVAMTTGAESASNFFSQSNPWYYHYNLKEEGKKDEKPSFVGTTRRKGKDEVTSVSRSTKQSSSTDRTSKTSRNDEKKEEIEKKGWFGGLGKDVIDTLDSSWE